MIMGVRLEKVIFKLDYQKYGEGRDVILILLIQLSIVKEKEVEFVQEGDLEESLVSYTVGLVAQSVCSHINTKGLLFK